MITLWKCYGNELQWSVQWATVTYWRFPWKKALSCQVSQFKAHSSGLVLLVFFPFWNVFLYVWLNEIFGWSQHEVCLSMVSLRGQYTGLIGSLLYWPQEVFVSGYRTLLRIDVEQQMYFSFLFWHILLVQIYWK